MQSKESLLIRAGSYLVRFTSKGKYQRLEISQASATIACSNASPHQGNQKVFRANSLVLSPCMLLMVLIKAIANTSILISSGS